MNIKQTKQYIYVFASIVASFAISPFAHANPGSLTDSLSGSCKSTGDCQLNDMVQVAINVSDWILILSGSLSLLAFIVGGLMMMLSGGNKDMVEKGKSALKGAVMGIIVVMLAFTIINFFMSGLGYQTTFGQWNTQN